MMTTKRENLRILGSTHISQSPYSILLWASVSVACYWQPFVWQVSEEPAPSVGGTKYHHLLLVFRTQSLKRLGLLV